MSEHDDSIEYMETYTVTDFINKLKEYDEKEIFCDGKQCGHHKLPSSVIIETDDEIYENIFIDIIRLPGCGCGCGIKLIVSKKKEDN